MTTPFYTSPEQIVRDRSDYARRGIARGRSVVVLTCTEGILFVAENPSKSLHKVSEIYDRIAFAAVGRYNEFENLRRAGVRYADVSGYQYDRRDVNALGLATAFAQTLGAVFIESQKPYEVEVVVAQVARDPDEDQIFRLTYDGSVASETGFVAMGGQAEAINTWLREHHSAEAPMTTAVGTALAGLAAGSAATAATISNGGGVGAAGAGAGSPGPAAAPGAASLEVALLDRSRIGQDGTSGITRRAFRRITDGALRDLVTAAGGPAEPGEVPDSADPE